MKKPDHTDAFIDRVTSTIEHMAPLLKETDLPGLRETVTRLQTSSEEERIGHIKTLREQLDRLKNTIHDINSFVPVIEKLDSFLSLAEEGTPLSNPIAKRTN